MKLNLPDGKHVPVLLLLFNRPDYVEQLVIALRKTKPENIYVNFDGPRHKCDEENIIKCEKKIAEINWHCEIKTNLNQANLGCKNSVIGAINWFFDHCSSGIILEDDCIPSESFFPFCALMLNKYNDDERVMQISGNNFIAEHIDLAGKYYFSSLNDIWGWATWRRAWQKISLDLSGYKRLISCGALDAYYTNKHAVMWEKKYLFEAQKADCSIWSSYWTYAMIKAFSFSIVPPVNLVQNIGFHGNGSTNAFESFVEYGKYKSSIITQVVEPEFFYPNQQYDAARFKIIMRTDPYFLKSAQIVNFVRIFLRRVHLLKTARTIYHFLKSLKHQTSLFFR